MRFVGVCLPRWQHAPEPGRRGDLAAFFGLNADKSRRQVPILSR
ncbi:hypothetical protein BN4901_1332 [Citrobacter europaeus]|uniref:Uncharacterized protein n=1 Tax=Citrobacter europaeus TaxID=1914243 RepID=A0ABY0JLS8_9ENTR|nr:hypothetical protein CIP106467_0051 [Citrobacter europaeus]SBW23884.1 hypothetical protein BN4901_1332 [Citrobacter europaeus]